MGAQQSWQRCTISEHMGRVNAKASAATAVDGLSLRALPTTSGDLLLVIPVILTAPAALAASAVGDSIHAAVSKRHFDRARTIALAS